MSLYNGAKRLNDDKKKNEENIFHGIALAHLVAYIKESHSFAQETPVVFRLAELVDLYTQRLQQLGVDISGRVHSTDLKRRLLARIPGLQAHKQRRDVLLAFNDDVRSALKQVYENDFDDEAIILLRGTNIIRGDILSTCVKFDRKFHTGCQQDSVTDSLKTFIGIV